MMNSDQLVSFPRWGGKALHLDLILPRLPYTKKFVETHCGSATITMNRHPTPIEVINDIDKTVWNFFQVLRNKKNEFLDLLRLTPYSKTEFDLSLKPPSIVEQPVEAARLFFVFARQSYMSYMKAWGITPNVVRNNMAQCVSIWWSGIECLTDVINRIKGTLLDCRDANIVIQKYDSKETTFYCDPPYHPEVRIQKKAYLHEMSDEAHRTFLDLVLSCKGKFAISGYHCSLYDDLLENWQCSEKKMNLRGTGSQRIECLWTNYDADRAIHTHPFPTAQIEDFLQE